MSPWRLVPVVIALLPAPAAAAPGAEAVAPSGQRVVLEEVLTEAQPFSEAVQVVVRLLAPAIAQEAPDDTAIRGDMDWACQTWGIAAAETLDTAPDRVVVEMMAASVPRARGHPATPFFSKPTGWKVLPDLGSFR